MDSEDSRFLVQEIQALGHEVAAISENQDLRMVMDMAGRLCGRLEERSMSALLDYERPNAQILVHCIDQAAAALAYAKKKLAETP